MITLEELFDTLIKKTTLVSYQKIDPDVTRRFTNKIKTFRTQTFHTVSRLRDVSFLFGLLVNIDSANSWVAALAENLKPQTQQSNVIRSGIQFLLTSTIAFFHQIKEKR